MLLTRLGFPHLWGQDPERLWPFMKYFVPHATLLLAPGSFAYGVERVPRSGGAVLAVNHFSAIDPPLIGSFSPRAIHYMTKAELFARPLVADVFRWTGGFPVERGGADREAMRTARQRVRDGRVVGIFVEGTRQRFGYPGPVHSGAVVVAMREGVPVIPCGVDSFGWSRTNRRPCAVVWGEPIELDRFPPRGSGYREAARVVGAEIVRLWRQAAEAAAAGFPDALPDGARRSGFVRSKESSRAPAPPPATPPAGRSASPRSRDAPLHGRR